MIAKKNKKADLERKRFAFLQIGLLVSGSLCLAAFEYSKAVPAEKQTMINETGENLVTEIQFDYVEKMQQQQQEQQQVVNLDEIEDVKVVKDTKEQGKVVTTTGNEVISIDGDIGGDLLSGDDLTLKDPNIIYDFPDLNPEFPGGEKAMFQWIKSNINYPELPRELGIGGKVFVEFIVNEDGSISRVKSLQAPHIDLAKEGERVVRMMPKWRPGEQAGKKVKVRYRLPIHFVQH